MVFIYQKNETKTITTLSAKKLILPPIVIISKKQNSGGSKTAGVKVGG